MPKCWSCSQALRCNPSLQSPESVNKRIAPFPLGVSVLSVRSEPEQRPERDNVWTPSNKCQQAGIRETAHSQQCHIYVVERDGINRNGIFMHRGIHSIKPDSLTSSVCTTAGNVSDKNAQASEEKKGLCALCQRWLTREAISLYLVIHSLNIKHYCHKKPQMAPAAMREVYVCSFSCQWSLVF